MNSNDKRHHHGSVRSFVLRTWQITRVSLSTQTLALADIDRVVTRSTWRGIIVEQSVVAVAALILTVGSILCGVSVPYHSTVGRGS